MFIVLNNNNWCLTMNEDHRPVCEHSYMSENGEWLHWISKLIRQKCFVIYNARKNSLSSKLIFGPTIDSMHLVWFTTRICILIHWPFLSFNWGNSALLYMKRHKSRISDNSFWIVVHFNMQLFVECFHWSQAHSNSAYIRFKSNTFAE